MMGSISSVWAMAQEKAAEAAAAASDGAAKTLERTDLEGGTFWLPPAASTNTQAIDWLFYVIMGLAIFCFVAITLAVVYFTIKYRRRPGHAAEPSPSHNDTLEITWTVIPSIICVFLFVWGWSGYVDINTPPKSGMEIGVTAQKWNWTFTYPNGGIDSTLHVPANKPVKLVMRSMDVLHSFYVPSFRVKMDVIPNRYTKVWFEAKDPGVYRLYCAEYCGDGHSQMFGLVKVHEPGPSYDFYLDSLLKPPDLPTPESRVAAGEEIYNKLGCKNCHSVDGAVMAGPTFKGVYGTERKFTDGSSGSFDENYVRESLLEPTAKVVAGYAPVMPTFKGQIRDWQIDVLISYMKSLK